MSWYMVFCSFDYGCPVLGNMFFDVLFLNISFLDNLLLDSLKGLIIVVLTWRCQVMRIMTRRY